MGDERREDTDRLLAHIRNVSAAVVLGLFTFAVLTGRDVTTLGLLFGALSVLLGIAGIEAVSRRNGNGR